MDDAIKANSTIMSDDATKTNDKKRKNDKKSDENDDEKKKERKKDKKSDESDDKEGEDKKTKVDEDKEKKDFRYKYLIDLIINNDDNLKKIDTFDNIIGIDDLLFYNEKLTKFYLQFYKGNPKIANNVLTKWNSINDTKKKASQIYKELLHNIGKLQGKFDKDVLIELMKDSYGNGETNKTLEKKEGNEEATTPLATPAQAVLQSPPPAPPVAEASPAVPQAAEAPPATAKAETAAQEAPPAVPQAEGDAAISALSAAYRNSINQSGGNFKDLKDSISKYKEIFNNDSDKESNIKAIADNYGFDNINNKGEITTPENAFSRFISSYTEGINDDTGNGKEKIIKAVDDLDNDPTNPLKSLEIKYDDRIVFIAITFVIRYVTLLLIMWCIEIDTIKSFNDAFMLFTFIYIVIFWFIVMIINANISQDSDENSILYSIKSVLYYFYFKINGIERLITHTVLILLLLTIPVIIKAEKKENSNEPLTYEEKIKLTNILSLFTIFMWVFTSIIATKF